MEIALFGAAREMKLRSEKGRQCSDMLSHGRNSSRAFKVLMNYGSFHRRENTCLFFALGCCDGRAGFYCDIDFELED